MSRAHQHLHAFIRDLVTKAAQEGTVRTDVPAGEFATYCIHSITAATGLPTKAAVRRLVTVILTGMKP